MEILCIVEQKKLQITEAYDTTYKTFAELKTSIDFNNIFFMLVKHNDIIYTTNLSDLMLDTIIGKCTTWSQVLSNLTEELVNGYSTTLNTFLNVKSKDTNGLITVSDYPINSSIDSELLIHSVLVHPGITVSYGIHTKPELKNIFSLKWKLLDIVFTKSTSNELVDRLDFSNCIPVINGIIHYPIFYRDELYAVGGTKVIAPESRNQELILMDTTPLGGMQVIKFTDCIIENMNDSDSYLKITMPENISMENKTPLMIIAGRLFFPFEFNRVNNTTLMIDTQQLNLNKIILKNNILREIFREGTTHITNIDTAINRKNLFIDNEHNDTFLILLNTPTVRTTIHNCNYRLNDNTFNFDPNCKGMLINKATREILDFTRIKYSTYDHITYTVPHQLYNLMKSYERNNSLGIMSCNYYAQELQDLGNSDIQFINLSI